MGLYRRPGGSSLLVGPRGVRCESKGELRSTTTSVSVSSDPAEEGSPSTFTVNPFGTSSREGNFGKESSICDDCNIADRGMAS